MGVLGSAAKREKKWNFPRFLANKNAPSDPKWLQMGFPTGYCSQEPPREEIFQKVPLASEIRAEACQPVSRQLANFDPKNDRVHSNGFNSFHSWPILPIESCGESILKGHDFKPKKSNFDRNSGAWRCLEVPRNVKKLEFSAVFS